MVCRFCEGVSKTLEGNNEGVVYKIDYDNNMNDGILNKQCLVT